ncbi:MAG: Coenzyme F420 hydrogenase/dehydrogenase, beta subunit C-terminal domain [Methanoregulaceae archaeon]|jgi:formate dehydrogenase subunit beta|nr:Coenzyme F420 hydrogenase/dehydrogenase, beta subunit C-terminal domain [Methanoregulaceae archaeon]MDD5047462.1 Coenzyme F420 hydrogenase/dehydrogenase, beta subunit C-terminal domain [Methanoregulaceae archaeon]MDD5686036.1 Coenzyme F420 hydrogenase/dehydrogenase, beta subunit C-terminal domain [Methanoregulaceae archaeon]
MVKKGDMLYAWTSDADIAAKAECGGAVTSLLKFALEKKMVDAVFAVKRGQDIYDAVPTLITDPKELDQTAGSLHCGTLLLSKLVKKYLNGANNMKIAMPVKGCDMMGLYELAKRQQVNLDNIIMIGVNCGGTVSPVTARKMIAAKFEVDPDVVTKEEIDKGQFIIEYEGGHKGISIDELEDEGYGRRSNCRRCKLKIPRQADLACGNWGVIGDKAGKATFVEVCSDKGANLLDAATKAGVVKTEAANPKGIEIRKKVEGAMLKLGDKWRARDFGELGEGRARLEKIVKETSRCIKCYQCIENCPICYCVECSTKKPYLVKPGEVPPNFMFHLIRFAHIADSCINCGQCQELCAMDIPNALFMHAQQTELEKMFGHVPGVSMELPLLALVEEKEERSRLSATGSDQIFDIFK